jgi:hypothetical protein
LGLLKNIKKFLSIHCNKNDKKYNNILNFLYKINKNFLKMISNVITIYHGINKKNKYGNIFKKEYITCIYK